jgi:hypothetical protein
MGRYMTGIVGIVVLGVAAVGCGGSSASSGTPKGTIKSQTSARGGTAQIVTFDVPKSVQCQSGPSTTFTVKYEATGASKRQLLVDGLATDLPDAKGDATAPVKCDALPHTVVLYVVDHAGKPTAQTKYLDTILPQPK